METRRFRSSDSTQRRVPRLLGVLGALAIAALAVLLVQPSTWAQANVLNFFTSCQGAACDNILEVGGNLDVVTGGDLDIESGATFNLAGTAVTASAAELNTVDGYTGTTAELNQLVGLSANAALPVMEGCTFTEDATNATHTCTVTIPADSWLLNIQIVTTVLWTDADTSLSVGDADDANGWFDDVDLAATDLVVGEVLDISNAENWGGTQGVYLVAATGVKGQAIAAYSGVYVPTASEVIGVVTMTTPSGTAGRTHMVVSYASPTLVAATAAP